VGEVGGNLKIGYNFFIFDLLAQIIKSMCIIWLIPEQFYSITMQFTHLYNPNTTIAHEIFQGGFPSIETKFLIYEILKASSL